MLLWADHRVIRHPYGQREQCFWSIELEGLRSFCGVALFALCFRVLEFFYNSAAVGGGLVPTPPPPPACTRRMRPQPTMPLAE